MRRLLFFPQSDISVILPLWTCFFQISFREVIARFPTSRHPSIRGDDDWVNFAICPKELYTLFYRFFHHLD